MILVSTNTLDFGNVTVDEDKNLDFTIFNTNNIEVNVTIASSNSVILHL